MMLWKLQQYPALTHPCKVNLILSLIVTLPGMPSSSPIVFFPSKDVNCTWRPKGFIKSCQLSSCNCSWPLPMNLHLFSAFCSDFQYLEFLCTYITDTSLHTPWEYKQHKSHCSFCIIPRPLQDSDQVFKLFLGVVVVSNQKGKGMIQEWGKFEHTVLNKIKYNNVRPRAKWLGPSWPAKWVKSNWYHVTGRKTFCLFQVFTRT